MNPVPLDQIEELPATERAELERRWQAFERNPDEGEPWDDVRKSLLND